MVSSAGGAISNIPIKKGTIFFVDLAICKLDFEPIKKKKTNTWVWLKQGSVDSEIVRNISIKHGQSISFGGYKTHAGSKRFILEFYVHVLLMELSKALPK